MKIIHFSDTHLGLNLENTSREEDFYNNFEKVIKRIIELKPNIVIHSGDLFHTAKPSNKAISIVVKNFLKLEEEGIKTIVIAGNHDTPRLSITTHSFEIFNEFKNFFVYYKPQINSIEINDINFVIIPHIHDELLFKDEFGKISNLFKKNKKNIFISHFGISAKEYDEYTDEISGININVNELENLKKFDYVALGHYHKNFCIGNICYPGSIEHTSFNQKDYNVGFNEITLGEKTEINKNYISTRNMVDLGDLDCKLINTNIELINLLEKTISKEKIKDSIVKINFININDNLLLDFNDKDIFNFFIDAFYFEFKKIKFDKINNNDFLINNSTNLIYDNFQNFMNNKNIENLEIKEKLISEIEQELKNI